MRQPDSPNRCLSYRLCSNPHGFHYDERPYRRYATSSCPLPSITVIFVIPAITSAAMTATTAPTPVTDQNEHDDPPTTTLTIATPTSSGVDWVLSCPHCDSTFASSIGLINHL
nr:unnamed protein product [Spirometra erinaceieuropaei]